MATGRRKKRAGAKRSPGTPGKASEATADEPIAVSIDHVNAAALGKVLGVDPRSVMNFVEEGMPKDGRGDYPLAKCVQWYIDRERQAARVSRGMNDLDKARLRKTDAEARKAELEARQLHGELIPTTDHEEIVGDLCDRLRATIVNIPSSYGMRLEEAGVSATVAESTLEAMADELMTALRGAADALDEEAAHDASGSGDDTAGVSGAARAG
jgi:phage terminase Nu1 subunit (DNA packaging protein)